MLQLFFFERSNIFFINVTAWRASTYMPSSAIFQAIISKQCVKTISEQYNNFKTTLELSRRSEYKWSDCLSCPPIFISVRLLWKRTKENPLARRIKLVLFSPFPASLGPPSLLDYLSRPDQISEKYERSIRVLLPSSDFLAYVGWTPNLFLSRAIGLFSHSFRLYRVYKKYTLGKSSPNFI